MLKKTLAAAVLMCAVPALANADWNLSTQARNVGGSITSANGTQTVVDNVKSTTLKSLTAQTISAKASTGYSIKSLTVTDTRIDPATRQLVKSVTDITASANSYSLTPADGHSYMVAAIFSASSVSITASNPGGTVSPSRMSLVYGTVLAKDLKFSFVPAKGYSITAITGAPAGTATVPGGVNQAAYVVIKAGTKLTSALNLAAVVTNNNVGLNSILPQVYSTGSTVSISATVTGVTTPSYQWTYISGPANVTTSDRAALGFTPGPELTLTGATSNKLQFPAPATAGQYMFKVEESVSKTTQYAMVKVVTTASDNGQVCQNCHAGNGIPSKSDYDQGIYTRYQASIHGESTHAACDACHFGGQSSGHPGAVTTRNIDLLTFKAKSDIPGGNGKPVAAGAVFCASCHSGAGVPGTPGSYPVYHVTDANSPSCASCHTASGMDDAHAINNDFTGSNVHDVTCQACHGYDPTYWNNAGKLLSTSQGPKANNCIACHDVAVNLKHAGNGFVNDNNGVRAVVAEFKKWSHHIVNPNGADPTNEQCAVCHLEGTVVGGALVIDPAKHMADNKIHLRNADTDADMAWDPAAPNHSTMDNFCMSCHDANGATSDVNKALQAIIKTGIKATAGNPFGDTISNRYDKMMRPAVTNVDSQFNTTNNSHHGVKGPRYSGRTRADGARQIARPDTFAQNSSATLQGIRSTMFDAGNFNALYVPLADANGEVAPRTGAASLGDDSTLHCGDCHTVGQWKVGSATNADGTATPDAIGAHGSNNEYMLRNAIGTDKRHVGVAYTVDATNVVTQTNAAGAYLVCYNCHSYNKYGSIFIGTGADAGNAAKAEMGNIQPHAGEYASGDRCNGPANTLSFNGYTTGAGTDGFTSRFVIAPTAEDLAAGYQSMMPDKGTGNIFGIQCLNCHNSGSGNAYGGIHGSANNQNTATLTVNPTVTGGAYIDGRGYTTKIERFLPGLGNAMHVPGTLGGVTTDGVTNDTNWEQKHWQQTANTVINYSNAAVSGTASAGAGCYTLGTATTAATSALSGPSVTGPGGPATSLMDTWGGCEDHAAAQGKGDHGFLKRIVRPVTY